MVINIADILCFKDSTMTRIQAEAVNKKRSPVTWEAILQAMTQHPNYNRYQLAKLLGCSEQTVDRRLHGTFVAENMGPRQELNWKTLKNYRYDL